MKHLNPMVTLASMWEAIKREVGILIQEECKTCAVSNCSQCLYLDEALEGREYHRVYNDTKEHAKDRYVCESCLKEIPEGEEKRLEDGDTMLCAACYNSEEIRRLQHANL